MDIIERVMDDGQNVGQMVQTMDGWMDGMNERTTDGCDEQTTGRQLDGWIE